MTPAATIALKAMTVKTPPESPIPDSDFLSSGLTLINLASYGRIDKGVAKGHIYRLVGKSGTGKSFLTRTIMAEAARNPGFDKYELIYDDVERGALMNTKHFFGQKLVDRLHPPAWIKKTKEPYYSRTVGEFFTRLKARMQKGQPVIWVEDSLDSLEPDAENNMTDGKAKAYSQELRKLLTPMQETKSILFLISQSRVNMKSMFAEEITAGGRALEHYPTVEIWLKKLKSITKTHQGQKYVVGGHIGAYIKKNRITGMNLLVQFPFYPKTGIDDLGSCVNFLIQKHHWKKVPKQPIITCPEINFEGGREELIQHIRTNELQREVKVTVGKVWHSIMESISVERDIPYE